MRGDVLPKVSTHRPLNVLVATPGGGAGQGGIDRMMAALKAELVGAPRSDITARFMATRGTGHIGVSWLHLLRFCAAMATGRMSGKLDLIHLNLASRGSTYRKILIAAWARLLGIPYVVHLHGAEYRSFWRKGGMLDGRIEQLFAKASRIIVLGSPWQAFVAERVPSARERIVVVPNAVEKPRIAHVGGGGSVHILFMGRIEERKGVPTLVKALQRMRNVPGWRATIAGDGAVDALRAEVSASGLADRVNVPGWLGANDTAQLLATGDVLTLPSLAENLPMSIIEAMAAGLAVVATPVGAVEDIVKTGETGLLVPPGNDEELAHALSELVTDESLRTRLGRAAQEFQSRHLDIGPYAERICRVWVDGAQMRLTQRDLVSARTGIKA